MAMTPIGAALLGAPPMLPKLLSEALNAGVPGEDDPDFVDQDQMRKTFNDKLAGQLAKSFTQGLLP